MLEQESVPSSQPNPLLFGQAEPKTEPAKPAFDVSLLKKIFGSDLDEADERVQTFTQRLCHELEPDQTTEEVVAKVVRTAVEVEFGQDGVKNLGLEKFMSLMTEAICLNKEMLDRTTALASRCLKVKLNISDQPMQ